MMAGRYAHAKQLKRHNRELKYLHTRLGRLIRDIRCRTVNGQDLKEIFAIPLSRADQVRRQRHRQRGWKLYSLHALEVECIGKAKAHRLYAFGVKVSIATTNARSPGGHTLGPVIEETQALAGVKMEHAHVDKGYRGHNAPKPPRVFRSGQRRGVFGTIK
jgi:IS5 family transposase